MFLVIFVKVSKSKGFYIIGMVLLTIQMPALFFDLVVMKSTFFDFFADNWTLIVGYGVLIAFFFKGKKVSSDLIIPILGVVLWLNGFLRIFEGRSYQPFVAVVFYIWGFLGVALVLIAVAIENLQE